MKRAPKVQEAKNGRLTREDWVSAALEVLIRDGVERVKVLPLAHRLQVTRGSFYWHFKDRTELLDTLLDRWTRKNTQGLVAQARKGGKAIIPAVLNVFELWLGAARFDPKLDFAIREWGRRSARVRAIVEAADEERVAALTRMFRRAGYRGSDAFIRARVLYAMQIGYFALEVREPLEQRLRYVAAYLRSFTGVEPPRATVQAFVRRAAAGAFERSAPGAR
jgi:AcrR family transcriptional regulator